MFTCVEKGPHLQEVDGRVEGRRGGARLRLAPGTRAEGREAYSVSPARLLCLFHGVQFLVFLLSHFLLDISVHFFIFCLPPPTQDRFFFFCFFCSAYFFLCLWFLFRYYSELLWSLTWCSSTLSEHLLSWYSGRAYYRPRLGPLFWLEQV